MVKPRAMSSLAAPKIAGRKFCFKSYLTLTRLMKEGKSGATWGDFWRASSLHYLGSDFWRQNYVTCQLLSQLQTRFPERCAPAAVDDAKTDAGKLQKDADDGVSH